jgi:hypothetical protein
MLVAWPYRSPVRLRLVVRPVLAAVVIISVVSCGAASGRPAPAARISAPPRTVAAPLPPPQLPHGGTKLFPAYRLIAYYGSGTGPGLGVLGRGTPEQAAVATEKQARAYAPFGRTVQPVMELITTTAQAKPGPDGNYSIASDPAVVQRYLNAARRHKMLLILDFQPGRGNFLPQVRRYERFLEQPDVGVALDSEWRMRPGQVPGTVIGSAGASEINAVSSYVAGIVAKHRLPEKVFLVHQFRTQMLPDRPKIAARPGLATIFHADGFGTQELKKGVYRTLALPGAPFHVGFKLFYKADTNMMSPAQAMALRPQPDLITYQ